VSTANLVGDGEVAAGGLIDDRYRVDRVLGEGRSATAYAATDSVSGQRRVLKVFRPENPAAAGRAGEEFRRLHDLAHPNIVRVRDLARSAGGALYLVTDEVQGPPITSIAQMVSTEGRREAFQRAARDLADALAYLHGRGVVHGDLSPANVRLDVEGRPVLFDFDLAGPRLDAGTARGATGTLGYASPEALLGERGPAGDLFSLGALLYESWTGAPPFGAGIEAVQRMLSGRAPQLSTVREGLSGAWDGIVAKLLEPRPEDRHASARELLREVTLAIGSAASGFTDGAPPPVDLDLRAPHPEGDPLAGIFVGRRAEREVLHLALERLAEGTVARSVVAVVGSLGSGRRTLIDLALRDARIESAARVLPGFEIVAGDLRGVAAHLALLPASPPAAGAGPILPSEVPDGDQGHLRERRFASIADRLEAIAQRRPVCVVLDESADAQAFASFVSGAEPSGRLLLLVPARAEIERPFSQAVTLAPLPAETLAELVARAAGPDVPAAALSEIARTSAGHAGTAALLTRRLVEALRIGEADRFRIESATDLPALLNDSLDALPAVARSLVVAVALGFDQASPATEVAGEQVSEAAGGAPGAAATAARVAGWLVEESPGAARRWRLPSEAHRRIAVGRLTEPALRAVAERAIRELTDDDVLRAEALLALGRGAEAAVIFRREAEVTAREGDLGRAAEHLLRAEAAAPDAMSFTATLTLVTGLAILGRYEEATGALERAEARAACADDRVRLAERRSWLLARQGDLAAAQSALEMVLGQHEGAETPALGEVRARLARLKVGAGRFDEALTVVAPALSAGGPPLAIEAALLARAYAGDRAGARTLLASLAGKPGAFDPGRGDYLAGLVDQLDGKPSAAVVSYRRAFDRSAAIGDVHTLAAVALNLGALQADAGAYGEALAATERAIRELGRMGATAELGTALFNAANLFVQLGQLGAARRALARARDEGARRGAAAVVEAFAAFVEGDLERREGQPARATQLYRQAAAALRANGRTHEAALALLSEAETLAEAGLWVEARRALAGAAEGRDADHPGTAATGDDEELAMARGRIDLCAGRADGRDVTGAQLAPTLRRLADRAAAQGRLPAAWRAALISARLWDREDDRGAADEARTFATRIFEEVRMATPEAFRAGLEADPEARWLAGSGGEEGVHEAALAARAAQTEGRLRRLLRINKRLNSELRLPRLLEMIVDTVIELTDAERGFLLLEDENGQLVVKVARNIDQRTLEAAEFELSRSIARQAATGGEPIVTIDAAGDARFKEAMSVSDLHLRSILAVPLHVKGRPVGTIYVDHRLRKGAFGNGAVSLVLDFAEQAAIAIENARLLGELRRRERQVEALNRRMQIELSARREELTGIKKELLQNREALAVRYDYRNIVGRTPRMLELFRLLDRITDTTLPVVIQGESGTGKELVARAIHFNGPRRDRPFVSENCAAIPETLLESTLFGYARGAFTGADHDTRGLFEVADGGTLFLDEVAEMSAGMQGKLLRVLQAGEFRRVGSERTRKVDVRIVAASNRDLSRMVEEGKFRQDLYFRLNVARIFLPPLRDRREDIPLIVEHLVAKHAAPPPKGGATTGGAKAIGPDVMARLIDYRWPGNVRELENEIMRAMALSGERITVADLSPQVAARGDDGPGRPEDPDSLMMRPRVERLERSLIREALARCGNNQTKAAEALGLSRFGLQKKLRRYNFS
jgi:transcriptional regulator with GAF, ATPase, and Fis domain